MARKYVRKPKRVTRRAGKFTPPTFVRASRSLVSSSQDVVQRVGNAIIGGDFTGNARGEYALDVQSKPRVLNAYSSAESQVASGFGAIALGANIEVSSDESVGIGNTLAVRGSGAVGFGFEVLVDGVSSFGAGVTVAVEGDNSVGLGSGVVVTTDDAVGIGSAASVTAARSVAIGYRASATNADEVVIAGTSIFLQTAAATYKKIWHENNDGAGSGLDADLLDGNDSAAFATSGHAHAATYAPIGSAFVTIGSDATLTGERALVGTSNQITVTDGGANGNVTLSTPQDIHASAAPQFASVTLHTDDAATTTAATLASFRHNSSGTPGVGFGDRLSFQAQSSTTENRQMALLDTYWATATDASRAARQVFFVYDTAAREALRLQASGSAPMIGFLGAGASARASAYTQTYSTANKTLNADGVTDPAAYGAGANGYSTGAMASAVHAAVIALHADLLDLKQFVNSLVDDLQTFGLIG